MKALVLAGGKGHRLAEKTTTVPKPLLSVGSKRLLDFSLQSATAAAVDEIIIVVSSFTTAIRSHYGGRYGEIPVSYVVQEDPEGLVHAIECAASALEGNDFLLLLADEVMIRPRLAEMVQTFRTRDAFAVLGVTRVTDRDLIRRTYTIFQDSATGATHRLIEKPRRPHNDVMGTGNCVFRNEILSYIGLCPINQSRREKELPDLIQCAIDDGHLVETFEITDRYINVNTLEDFEKAEALLKRYAESFR
jgi:NDP-sugar pyrophosphorylase family protein